MSWLSRFANVFRSSGIDRVLDDEITFHIESRIADLVAAGMTPDEAEAMARRLFGNRLRLREESRDVKLLPWLDSPVRDVRLGARMLRKNGLVTVAAVVSLSLALGACIAAFSLVDALLLKPLPVYRPEQLIYLTVPSGLYAVRFVQTMLFEVAPLRCLESGAAARYATADGGGGCRRSRLARGTRRSGDRATQ